MFKDFLMISILFIFNKLKRIKIYKTKISIKSLHIKRKKIE